MFDLGRFIEDCRAAVAEDSSHIFWRRLPADFLKFVARRIARYPALLGVTYREEEVSPRHPMMRAVADVPPTI